MESQKNVLEDKNMPEKKFRAGLITATVWRNVGKNPEGDKVEFKSVSLEKSYKDKEGNWQKTNSLNVNDLHKVILVLQEAQKYMLLKQE